MISTQLVRFTCLALQQAILNSIEAPSAQSAPPSASTPTNTSGIRLSNGIDSLTTAKRTSTASTAAKAATPPKRPTSDLRGVVLPIRKASVDNMDVDTEESKGNSEGEVRLSTAYDQLNWKEKKR